MTPVPREKWEPRAGTKQAVLIGMLGRDGGASIKELIEGTGWQANTIHSALATLRKRGLQIAVDQTAPEKRYQITGPLSTCRKRTVWTSP
jgi:DNA-binding IclR family transcriptional regulator